MMHNTDISKLLTTSLVAMGCDPALIGDLDAHNDIVLDFHDVPSIHLRCDGDEVRIWAALGERHDYQVVIDTHAPKMLLALTAPQAYTVGGNLMLSIQDETLQLTALLHPDYLSDSEKFGVALNAFFERIAVFNQIISD
jgi:hypothetical protein